MGSMVSIMSDLHLEFHGCHLPGGDIAILAGDIWLTAGLRGNSHPHWKTFAIFAERELSKYREVLMVTGNHESYKDYIEDANDVIRAFLREHAPHVTLLANETKVIDGIAFLGTPLWAPCGTKDGHEATIRHGMNDFRLIRTRRPQVTIDPAPRRFYPDDSLAEIGSAMDDDVPTSYRIFTPTDAAMENASAIAWLKEELPKHERCIVIGHHAPSLKSNGNDPHHDPRAGSAHCNDLDALIVAHPQIKFWIHGHTHRRESYKIGATEIVANPRGYFPDEYSSRRWDPQAADFDLDIL